MPPALAEDRERSVSRGAFGCGRCAAGAGGCWSLFGRSGEATLRPAAQLSKVRALSTRGLRPLCLGKVGRWSWLSICGRCAALRTVLCRRLRRLRDLVNTTRCGGRPCPPPLVGGARPAVCVDCAQDRSTSRRSIPLARNDRPHGQRPTPRAAHPNPRSRPSAERRRARTPAAAERWTTQTRSKAPSARPRSGRI
jgi:hypothetical protein